MVKKSALLSVIIISGNEQDMITDCLRSVSFADEIILVLTPSNNDQTSTIAQTINPHIITTRIKNPEIDFSSWRNHGLSLAGGKWILFIDPDERLSPPLKENIQQIIKQPKPQYVAYDLPRANYFLGKRVRHGGTYPDYVQRLFLATKLKGYQGKLHEQPQIEGQSTKIKHDLLHFTHRDLTSMMEKTIKWTLLEAKLLHQSHHPPVVWWRFPRMMFTKFFERMIKQKMFLDGTVGWISVIFEVFNTFIIYARLWEIQQHEKSRHL